MPQSDKGSQQQFDQYLTPLYPCLKKCGSPLFSIHLSSCLFHSIWFSLLTGFVCVCSFGAEGEARASRGRGRRGRGGHPAVADEIVMSGARRLRNRKIFAPSSPARADGTPMVGKRRGQSNLVDVPESEETPPEKDGQSSQFSDVIRKVAPASLIYCPEPGCAKKYRHINGLRYHQSHAHGDSTFTKQTCLQYGPKDSPCVDEKPFMPFMQHMEKSPCAAGKKINKPLRKDIKVKDAASVSPSAKSKSKINYTDSTSTTPKAKVIPAPKTPGHDEVNDPKKSHSHHHNHHNHPQNHMGSASGRGDGAQYNGADVVRSALMTHVTPGSRETGDAKMNGEGDAACHQQLVSGDAHQPGRCKSQTPPISSSLTSLSNPAVHATMTQSSMSTDTSQSHSPGADKKAKRKKHHKEKGEKPQHSTASEPSIKSDSILVGQLLNGQKEGGHDKEHGLPPVPLLPVSSARGNHGIDMAHRGPGHDVHTTSDPNSAAELGPPHLEPMVVQPTANKEGLLPAVKQEVIDRPEGRDMSCEGQEPVERGYSVSLTLSAGVMTSSVTSSGGVMPSSGGVMTSSVTSSGGVMMSSGGVMTTAPQGFTKDSNITDTHKYKIQLVDSKTSNSHSAQSDSNSHYNSTNSYGDSKNRNVNMTHEDSKTHSVNLSHGDSRSTSLNVSHHDSRNDNGAEKNTSQMPGANKPDGGSIVRNTHLLVPQLPSRVPGDSRVSVRPVAVIKTEGKVSQEQKASEERRQDGRHHDKPEERRQDARHHDKPSDERRHHDKPSDERRLDGRHHDLSSNGTTATSTQRHIDLCSPVTTKPDDANSSSTTTPKREPDHDSNTSTPDSKAMAERKYQLQKYFTMQQQKVGEQQGSVPGQFSPPTSDIQDDRSSPVAMSAGYHGPAWPGGPHSAAYANMRGSSELHKLLIHDEQIQQGLQQQQQQQQQQGGPGTSRHSPLPVSLAPTSLASSGYPWPSHHPGMFPKNQAAMMQLPRAMFMQNGAIYSGNPMHGNTAVSAMRSLTSDARMLAADPRILGHDPRLLACDPRSLSRNNIERSMIDNRIAEMYRMAALSGGAKPPN